MCGRKKKYSRRVFREPTKRLYERIKRSKECRKSDETAADVSAALYRESMRLRNERKKSKTSRKQDEEEAEAYDKDVPVETRDDRKRRKEERRREKKEKERKERERKEREREERRRERYRHEEEMLRPVDDVRLMTHDKDNLVSERQQPLPPPPPVTDPTKTCCYLCAQNTLAIAAAASKPEQSDKCVQVSAHKLRAETPPTLDRSCSPTMLLVRTVQSSVRVRTRETSTLCPGLGNKETEALGTKTRKKFSLLPRLTRTKCQIGRAHV